MEGKYDKWMKHPFIEASIYHFPLLNVSFDIPLLSIPSEVPYSPFAAWGNR